MAALVNSLAELGWLEPVNIPDKEDTEKIWAWLSANTKSRYIEFVANAHYSVKWDKETREKTKPIIMNRLKGDKDIDLMIAMGTWAGQDMANNDHSVPVIVCSVSDALASKIVKSVEDSGYDHVNAHLDPARYVRQIYAFHDVIGFKKLGVAFQDTVDG
ncbi:MAG: hypothetical protein HC887_06150 [Desulfobacteraceae bacterium]|nr:hypothetical protein [Desulfobacteraceae bacterium]